jgi:hypothetical protein
VGCLLWNFTLKSGVLCHLNGVYFRIDLVSAQEDTLSWLWQ